MKTKSLIIPALAALCSIGISACEGIKGKVFNALIARGIEEEFTIPPVTTTNTVIEVGNYETHLNIDSFIKAETKGAFSLNSVKAVYIQSVVLTLENPDPANNFANLEQAWIEFYTDAKTDPIQIATGINPDVYAETWTLPNMDKTDLKPYLYGTRIFYKVMAKARRETTKELRVKMVAKFRVE